MGELSKQDGEIPERLPDTDGPIARIGQWYWVTDNDEKHFACVFKVGSNFVELHSPQDHTFRIHFNEFDKKCVFEADPEGVIRGRIDYYRDVVREKLSEIQALTARLGVSNTHKLEDRHPAEDAGTALSVLSGTDNLKKYKSDLIQAKDKDLPKLFEEVKEAHKHTATWMKAQVLPLKGMMDGMEGAVEKIEDRIFNVSLYAGLSEEVVRVKKGAPAALGEKLRILQRLCYMDEECLANYRHGGMTFEEIGEFDEWLTEPENLARILPFPRCMVAFQVRRGRKDRGLAQDLATAFLHFKLEQLDKLTFLYIRNGEQLYRMNCDLDFGPLIFPGKDEFNLDEPMMAHIDFDEVKDILTRRHYEDLVKEGKQKIIDDKKAHAQWKKENPGKDEFWSSHYHSSAQSDLGRLERDYEPFNQTSVYYDEIKGEVERRVKYYNRIALIVQGLYDRSEILHPHPPVQLWSPGGFEAAVELVYADHALHHGEAPDFGAYRKTLNALLSKGSVTIGQEDFWERKEAERENSRWNRRGSRDRERFRPYGNPGPGYLSKVDGWTPRTKKALYRWTRERLRSDYWGGKKYGDPLPCNLAVPQDELFNVSAYKPGDFKRFYQDPRTRAQYLQWAPLLLAAEEFHAGNLKMGKTELEKKPSGRP